MGTTQPAEPPLTAEQRVIAEKIYRRVRALQQSGVTMMMLSAPPDGTLKLRPLGHAVDVLLDCAKIEPT